MNVYTVSAFAFAFVGEQVEDEGDSDNDVIFLGKDSSELVMVPQTTYLCLHGW